MRMSGCAYVCAHVVVSVYLGVCVSEICMYGVSNGCVDSGLDISIYDRAM